jgi:hypothetical protein
VNDLNNQEFNMSFRLRMAVLVTLALAVGVGVSPSSQAQENPFGATTGGSVSSSGSSSRPLRTTNTWYGFAPATPTSKLLRGAADAVHNAKGDEETKAATKKLSELVDKCFDEDMVQRKKEFEQLEKRLANLREQLDRRKTKKSEIVELQMKVLLNEADGLGFFSSSERGDSKVPMVNSPYGLPVIAQPGDPTPLFNAPTPTPTAPATAAPPVAPVAPRAAEAR